MNRYPGNALSPSEHVRLAELEAVVERGLTTFAEVGMALFEIRDSRLYRQSHATFETYCKERWQFGASRARQLIRAARAIEEGIAPKDSTEREVRALLARLEPQPEYEPGTLDALVPPFDRELVLRSYLDRLAKAGWKPDESDDDFEWVDDAPADPEMLTAFIKAGLTESDVHRVFQMGDGRIPLDVCRTRFGWVVWNGVTWATLSRVLSLCSRDYRIDTYLRVGAITPQQAEQWRALEAS